MENNDVFYGSAGELPEPPAGHIWIDVTTIYDARRKWKLMPDSL